MNETQEAARRCWRCGNPMQPERPACPNSEIGAPCMSEGPPVPPKHRPVASSAAPSEQRELEGRLFKRIKEAEAQRERAETAERALAKVKEQLAQKTGHMDEVIEACAIECDKEADREAALSDALDLEPGLSLAHSAASWTCMQLAQRIRALKKAS